MSNEIELVQGFLTQVLLSKQGDHNTVSSLSDQGLERFLQNHEIVFGPTKYKNRTVTIFQRKERTK